MSDILVSVPSEGEEALTVPDWVVVPVARIPDLETVEGASAYEVAVANGFVGDEAAWLASLVGATGAAGAPGAPGDEGPPGPTAVSADVGNLASLGTDDLVHVAPDAVDGAVADAIADPESATAVALSSTFVAQADLTVTTGASIEGSNTGDQDLSGLLTTAAAPELIRDTMASALVAGANVNITPDDGADTITIAAAAGGSDPWTYAIVTSATTTTSVTPANINGLAVPALADGLWEVEGIALGYGASATEGAMVGLGAAPSGATVYSFAIGPATVTGTFASHFPDANAAATLPNSGGSGTRILARFGAVIRASTMADAWPLTIRSETAGQTSGVVADSFLRYRRIAD